MNTPETKYISIIIPSYNSICTIRKTIEGIFKLNHFSKVLEIIVVDSSDDDKTKNYLNSIESPIFQVFTSGLRVMPAKQRNIGAGLAKGSLLLFIDSDAIPEADWVFYIDKAYTDGIKVGGGSYLFTENQSLSNRVLAQYYLQFNEFIPAGVQRIKKMVPACNFFCDRDLFISVGGFPLIRAGEDSLFGINVNKVQPLYFLPQAKMYHIFRENSKDFFKNQVLLGKYVIIYRKLTTSSIYNKTIFLIALYPSIIVYKYLTIYFRMLSEGQGHFKNLNKAIFQFSFGMIYWASGVWKGIFSNKEII